MSVMDRVREAAARAAAGPLAGDRERPVFPRVAAQSPFPPEAGPEDLIARFRTELETLSGRVYGPLCAGDAAEKVVELIRQKSRGADVAEGTSAADAPEVAAGAAGASPRVLSWAGEEMGCPGLADALRQAAIEMVPGSVPNDDDHQRALEGLASLEVGLSGAVAGLADTGSIVVASGPGRSRVASLLPPVHLAVLPVANLYPTLDGWLREGGAEMARDTANIVVITGPSRTSDIEMQLTLGMHGPKELHVVLVR